MIKLPVVAALVTVLAHHIRTPAGPPSAETLREYTRVLSTLGTLATKSQDLELQRARDVCMTLFSKL